MQASDCKSCHQLNTKGIGPSFLQVAEKYKKDANTISQLTKKVIEGGAGVWGETAMPAHPTMKEGEVKQVIQWIFSLNDENSNKKSLPAKGTFTPKTDAEHKNNTVLAFTASYTDLGGAGIKPLSGSTSARLRNNLLDARGFESVSGFTAKDSAGVKYFVFPAGEGKIKISNVDLSGIAKIEVTGLSNGKAVSYMVGVNIDNETGNNGIAKITFGDNKNSSSTLVNLKKVSDGKLHDVYLTFAASAEVGQKPLLKNIKFIAE